MSVQGARDQGQLKTKITQGQMGGVVNSKFVRRLQMRTEQSDERSVDQMNFAGVSSSHGGAVHGGTGSSSVSIKKS